MAECTFPNYKEMTAMSEIEILTAATLVIGSGAAGLNTAHELALHGHDVLVATQKLGSGTSFDAGSDKQTYYKLSIQGGERDSVADLAETFFAGGGIQGEHALTMAALSLRGFYKLVQLGVPFPHDAYGQYAGYKTDHDPRNRATSAGPLTSRYMGEALLSACRAVNVRFRERLMLGGLLQDAEKKVIGALFFDENDQKPVVIAASQVVLCTGGSAKAFLHSVYPYSQSGGMGHAFRAGAKGNNLHCWQFGLGSVKVRWNVSGSYQQVLPRYVSTDIDGNNPQEFLQAYFTDGNAMLEGIFLKGYQWPYDIRKTGKNGSSLVDIAVEKEISMGRRVFMDFRQNPDEMPADSNRLPNIVREYWVNSDCIAETPIERLLRMNPDAVSFYRNHGIDLSTSPLEIAVNAQHQNGGIWVDAWWRTSLPGLYAAGECAGIFGKYRPGGSALNETQCGSVRVSQHILQNGCKNAPDIEFFRKEAAATVEAALVPYCSNGMSDALLQEMLQTQRTHLSEHAGISPQSDKLSEDIAELKAVLANLEQGVEGISPAELAELLEITAVQIAVSESVSAAEQMRGNMSVVYTPGGGGETVPVHPIPVYDDWFESVWRDYRENKVYGGKSW